MIDQNKDLPSGFLKAFITIARTGSYTSAGHHLGVTQSALSQKIHKLEKNLGFILFEKETRPLKLTKEGKEFLLLAERLNEEQNRFAHRLSVLAGRKIESLNIGISETAQDFFASDMEVSFLPRFQMFSCRSALIPKIQDEFASGNLDIAIAPGLKSSSDDAYFQPLVTENYLIIHPKTAEINTNDLSIDLLKEKIKLPFLSYREDSQDRRITQRILRCLGLHSSVSYELENTRALASAVKNGLGWTILPPMNLWSIRHQLDRITIHPTHGIHEEKRLLIAGRSSKFQPLVHEIAKLFIEKFQMNYLPQMIQSNSEIGKYIQLHTTQ